MVTSRTLKRRMIRTAAAVAALGGGAAGLVVLGARANATTATGTLAAYSQHLDGVAPTNAISIAAGVLGMTEADLRTALQGGKSIADVAKDNNVDLQKVIDAVVAAENAATDDALAAGKITQAQADERKASVVRRVTDRVNRVGIGGPGGKGGPGVPGGDGVVRPDDVAVAAGALGISEADLRTALQGGKSIADVAKDNNVDLQKVIDALVAADTKALDDAVAAGKITQAQADTQKTGLTAHVTDEVNRAGFGGGPGGPGGPGRRGGPGGPGGPRGPGGPGGHDGVRVDALPAAATALGMSEADLRTALQSGKSLADVAKDHNVDVQKVIDALVAAETKAIDDAVAAGTITQAQADARKADLVARVTDRVNHAGGPRGGRGHGPGGPGDGGAPPADAPSTPPTTAATNS